ncbi:MAG: hypothetical protein ACK5RL_17485 [Acidimicrobiales bacterium]
MSDQDDARTVDPVEPADAALLDELGRAIERFDDVPDRVVAAARGAFTWRTIERELAELEFDASVPAGVRNAPAGPTNSAFLRFVAGRAVVEVELVEGAAVGQVEPPGVTLIIDTANGQQRVVESDPVGQFSVFDLPGGPTRIQLTAGDGVAVVTDWFTVPPSS